MDPASAGMAASGMATGILGGYLQNRANAKLQGEANNANAQMAADTRLWMEQMSNTAHQREVRDLKAAGLNPILSATGGSGASTPSGPTANFQAAKMEDAVGKGVSSARDAYQLALANKSTEADVAYKDASTVAATAQAAQSVTTAKKMEEETKGISLQNAVTSTNMPAVKSEAALRQTTADYDKSAAGYDAIMNRALGALSGISGALGKVFRPEPSSVREENKKMKSYLNRQTAPRKK